MLRPLIALSALLAAATPAMAKADIETTITAPTSTYVYANDTYDVKVKNVGNKNADGVELVIQLPETNTSPTVHVMGVVGSMSSSCSQVGNTIECSLGKIRKNRSKTISFDIAFPENDGDLIVDADATTTSSEDITGNNGDSVTAVLDNYAVIFTAPVPLTNDHCTGTGLTSYYECTLYPSSITSHNTTLNADYSISFDGNPPGYTGTWSSSGSDHLAFEYRYNGNVVADFEGWGVDTDCWEGVTIFTGSGYVAPYHVCR